MTPELKTKWLAALRSGKYHQTQQTLRESFASGKVGHCCLGVLCEVVDLPRDVQEPSGNILLSYPEDNDGLDVESTAELLYPQLQLVGLTTDEQAELITLNDDKMANFHSIALWIEANL